MTAEQGNTHESSPYNIKLGYFKSAYSNLSASERFALISKLLVQTHLKAFFSGSKSKDRACLITVSLDCRLKKPPRAIKRPRTTFAPRNALP